MKKVEEALQSALNLNSCELAKRWFLSPRTLERWRWEGCGPPHLKICGRVLYRLKDIEEFEEKNIIHKTQN